MRSRGQLGVGILIVLSMIGGGYWLPLVIRELSSRQPDGSTVSGRAVVNQAVVGFVGLALLALAVAGGLAYVLRGERRLLRHPRWMWPLSVLLFVLWMVVSLPFSGS